ncbi:LAQU0S01e08394g1_1 [Lachancea quebecensis]|uniref:LAQU0S01e08394g1_1 n=1 Tax=Lachancea quebecensis TaxID=1654605 RepID=A0A0P1KX53_9SACH|nr:LAQU0S01e08394g1_1 [Lachancea quebecensis]
MSLISAAADVNDASSTTSAGSVRSSTVYRKDGKPLSQEALYRAQQKYGVFQSPARQTGSGVKDSKMASDVAANLANNNRTTIEAYKRVLDSNASRAATAVSSRSRSSSVTSSATVVSTNSKSTNAAVKALSAKPVEQPVAPKKTNMNMSKILVGAEAAAEKRIGIRMKPEKVVYVPSKESGKAAERSMSITPEVMDKLKTKGEYEAEAEVEADPKKYASKAAYAVRDFDPNEATEKDLLEREKRKQAYFGMLTSPQVLSLARANAQVKLDQIDKDAPGSLYKNEEFNKLAVALAQKNSTKRSEHHGKINMGGGLWLTQADVQNIAQGLITPVLDEVDSRALQQRAVDEDIKQRKIDFKEQNAAWIELQRNKLSNDKMYSRETRLRHKRETDGLHTRTERKFQDLCASKDSEVAEMEKALQNAKDSYAALQKQMEEDLEKERLRVEAEVAALKKEQEEDLKAARVEQEQELKPYVDDVKAAEAEHERLINERDSLNKEIEDLRASIESHKVKIEELDKEISDSVVKHEEEEGKREELTKHKEEFDQEVSEKFTVMAQVAKEKAQKSSEEARLKQLEVDAMINERQSELNSTELELKKEKLSLLEAMRNVTELKGEDKLDENRVKALIGMTSDEFIAENNKSVNVAGDKLEPSKEHSASTKSIKHEAGVIGEGDVEKGFEVQPAKDSVASEHVGETGEKSTEHTKTSSPYPAKPSMVDAVLPKDFKPEVKPRTKPVQKTAQHGSGAAEPASPKSGVKRSPSLKQKFMGIIKGDTKSQSKPAAAATPANPPASVKKAVPKKAAASSEADAPAKASPAKDTAKTEIQKIAQSGPAPEPEHETAPAVGSTAETSVSTPQKPTTFGVDKSEIHRIAQGGPAPTSGHSNGTKTSVYENGDNSDDEGELPDSSEAGENGIGANKKGSLFKEVF